MKMTESIWSKEAPTEPGYYWVEFAGGIYEIARLSICGSYWSKMPRVVDDALPWLDDVTRWGQRIELWDPPPKEEPEFDQTDEIVDIMEYRREVSRKRLLKQLERDGLKGKE